MPVNPIIARLPPWASRRAHAWLDAFLLRGGERLATSYPEVGHAKLRAFVLAGRERAGVADDLVESHAASALTLYREAALLYMAAYVTGAPGAPLREPLDPGEVTERFQARLQSTGDGPSPEALAAFVDSLRAVDLLALDRIATVEAITRSQTARALVSWLGTLVEPRTVREVKFERRVRVGVVGVVALALLVAAVSAAFSGENIALHKPVSVSGQHPNTTSPPSGLTDGITSGTYGVHTNSCDLPFVQVDLQDVYAIDKVKVYNRGDGWFDDGLPFTLQFSEDGRSFTDVEVRSKSFGQVIPWTADGGKRHARYVRIHGGKGRYVTLSELEVFGKKP